MCFSVSALTTFKPLDPTWCIQWLTGINVWHQCFITRSITSAWEREFFRKHKNRTKGEVCKILVVLTAAPKTISLCHCCGQMNSLFLVILFCLLDLFIVEIKIKCLNMISYLLIRVLTFSSNTFNSFFWWWGFKNIWYCRSVVINLQQKCWPVLTWFHI